MARVKTARTTRARHKKILKQAKGYYGAKHYRFRNANQAVMKSLSYAYVGRKDKKSNFRKLWIARINAAARMNGTTYSKMIAGLKKANVTINRKMLADLAISDPKAFTELVEVAKKAQINERGVSRTSLFLFVKIYTIFDEKIKGSFHFTPGDSLEESDNGNRSAIHWDIVNIQTPEHGGGEIYFDDVLVRKDGRFVLEELECLNPENLV